MTRREIQSITQTPTDTNCKNNRPAFITAILHKKMVAKIANCEKRKVKKKLIKITEIAIPSKK